MIESYNNTYARVEIDDVVFRAKNLGNVGNDIFIEIEKSINIGRVCKKVQIKPIGEHKVEFLSTVLTSTLTNFKLISNGQYYELLVNNVVIDNVTANQMYISEHVQFFVPNLTTSGYGFDIKIPEFEILPLPDINALSRYCNVYEYDIHDKLTPITYDKLLTPGKYYLSGGEQEPDTKIGIDTGPTPMFHVNYTESEQGVLESVNKIYFFSDTGNKILN